MVDEVSLGQTVKDEVTGIEGTVTGVSDHLSDCQTAQIEYEQAGSRQSMHLPITRLVITEIDDNGLVDDDGTASLDRLELGQLVRDRITGFTGIITMTGRHIDEATKVYVRPAEVDEDGDYPSGQTLHATEVEVIDEDGVQAEAEEMVEAMPESAAGPVAELESVTDLQ